MRDGLGKSREDRVAVAPGSERSVESRSDPFRAKNDEGAERQSGNRQAGAAGGEPTLGEPEARQREDDAAEHEQLGALLELGRSGDADPVGRRRAADLRELLGG